MKIYIHIPTCIVLLFCFSKSYAQVYLNEILASNASTIADPGNGEYNDWLELYNAGAGPVDLTGWHLSDSDDPTEWAFPAGTVINAKGFLLIWADGTGLGLHTNFRLGAGGEQLSLFNAGDAKVSQIDYVEQPTDVSYGRQTDGSLKLGFFSKPTPGASNNTSVFYTDYVRQIPFFSKAGGFFTGPVTITISDKYNAGIVRYTLDGAVPSENSPVFAQPIQINATTVVKARMFYAGQLPGPVVTNTYFINEGFEHRGLAVMSLSTDPKYFFDQDSGLYVQDFKPTWEYPVHLEFYEPDGLLGFHHDAGVQIGGENAWILPQKLLNIFSRKKYGSGHFDYQLYPDNPKKRFGDIILRCSGSDWSYTIFRDGLMQGLIKAEADLDGQDFRPCAVYINGQYFGIHNIREKQDAEYTEYYHHIAPDDLDYIENDGEIKEGDAVAYNQLVSKLNAGVQSDAAFQALDAIANTKDFTDYIISQIFVANTSWGHNIALFRPRSSGGRWRWLLHDYDRGFNLSNVNSTAMNWATATNGDISSNPAFGTLFLRKMLENNAFKQRFITRFADHLYITYNPVTIDKRVDLHAGWIRSEIPYQVARWEGTTSSYGDAIPSVAFWENEVSALKQYGVQRNSFMLNDLNSFFGLGGTTTLDLDVSDVSHGFIRLHEMKVPSYPWTGKYFRNRLFTLTAEAKPGFNFVRWEKMDLSQTTLLAAGSVWKYRDATIAPPTDWNQPGFNDAAWPGGPAQLGYGDGDEATVLSFGGNTNSKTPAYYFRSSFNIPDPAVYSGLLIRLIADDGAVVYLNGKEIWRINMPSAPALISFTTLAIGTVQGSGEGAWNELTIPSSLLVSGQNEVSVEIHQVDRTSSDISFDFEMQGTLKGTPEIISNSPSLDVTLDVNPRALRAVFESDGSCGILPDTVFQNLSLDVSCSPYIASGDVVVKPNVTLTVQPGVEIRFSEKANLWILGDLQMNGTVDAPINVKNDTGSETWGGIFLKNATSTSSLSYVTLENASAGTQRFYYPAAISAYHSDITLDHMDLTSVKDNPVFARFSDVIMTNSKLKSAVTGDCINVKQGFAIVENCDFEGGTQPDMDGIDFDGVVNGIARNNHVHDFRGDNCDGLDIGEQCQGLLIEHNFIHHCFDKGISVGQESSATVVNNVIAYTNIGIALKDESDVQVEHCTFFGNQKGVSAYEKNAGNLGGTGHIVDCIVSNASLDAYDYDSHSGLTLTRCLSDLDSISYPGNINADPHFINPTLFDFNLLPASPAIGIGASGSNLGANTLPVYTGLPQLMISEILYNDTLTSTGEFIEIYNPGAITVDMSNYKLSAAVDFTFPAGATILPGGTVVVAKTASNFSGAIYPVYQWESGKLRNEGEVIYLIDRDGLLVDFVRYNNHTPWPESNTLKGKSIELVSGILDNHFATSWVPSKAQGGSPGEVSGVSGTTPELNDTQFTIYPNPASDVMYVAFKEYADSFTIRIIDIIGREVLSRTSYHENVLNQARVDLTHLDHGSYFVVIEDERGRVIGSEVLIVQ
ncbi:MAG: lamin tail domain-containing protein [Saprospiraceae bacterium]|uniref:Lamin tail domain-containing protein n=1 Tax=Candidatus Opimibacter skivensis TaxID=2982028 RepID=A0A9D7T0R3_9BACT|nr:lamin tail domain-containing protein [Candidatus Opimibacter skivensis]